MQHTPHEFYNRNASILSITQTTFTGKCEVCLHELHWNQQSTVEDGQIPQSLVWETREPVI